MAQFASNLKKNHTGRKRPTRAMRLASFPGSLERERERPQLGLSMCLPESHLQIISFSPAPKTLETRLLFLLPFPHTELGAPVVIYEMCRKKTNN